MRAGGNCAVQQALTAEAAGVVKQAVVLAKRRGHAQVTPLHVANTMLAASSGLFRAACLESHSHPLQCKALELCFNVALNRLPASSSNPILGHHSPSPSISNALVAAFKRAQAHQRRGSIENQQQPLLAVKIELEQLIISILDDPSVSRVMREAGFSSTQVKTNVERSISLELCSSSSSQSLIITNQTETKSNERTPLEAIKNEDVKVMIEALLTSRKSRKSLVLVGEAISNLDATVRALMDTVDKGDVPEGLKELKFVSIPPFYSFCNLHREEIELKVRELSCVVKSLVGKGVVLYLGDLKWISDYRVSLDQERSYYCSVEHMIMEIGSLVWGIGEIERFWLVGIATFQTYMRCRNGSQSLESVWGLHPVTIPANSLGFSLLSERDGKIEDRHGRVESETSGFMLTNGEIQLSCCKECTAKFEAEARNFQVPTLSSLPSWLKKESRRLKDNDQEAMKELYKKWYTLCSSSHKRPGSLQGTLISSSPPPSSSTSFFPDQPNLGSTRIHFPLFEPTRKDSNPYLTSNSGSSSDNMDMEYYTQKFKDFNTENLNMLCNALEEKVPSQREIIPEIAGAILQCRSGMLRRKDYSSSDVVKEETWLLFLGHEAQAKEKISRELAKTVFGSYSSFVSIGLSSFVSPTRADSSDDCRNKRVRDEQSCKRYIDRFAEVVFENPHRVFLMEDLDQADYCSQVGIKKAIESGRLRNENGEEGGFSDAIIVLSCESFSSRSRASSPSPKQSGAAGDGAGEEEGGGCFLLDLNISFDDDGVGAQSLDELGIVENVDRRVVFKRQSCEL